MPRSHENDWSTSLAVLYNAIIKLSHMSEPAVVFRGVKEDKRKLPDYFLPPPESNTPGAAARVQVAFAGGVEKAFMSTTKDPLTAVRYAGSVDAGSIMQLTFDIGSRGAMVNWLSQYPAEEELLYPPCTSLTCAKMQQVGCRRVLQVKASVSTRRPDVSWCKQPTDEPTENLPKLPESLGPFALQTLDMESFDCFAYGRNDADAHMLHLEKGESSDVGRKAVWTIDGMALSPIWRISLNAEGRDAILIPREATHYAFAYPLEDEDLLKQLEYIRDENLQALSRVGGFVYLQQTDISTDDVASTTTTMQAAIPEHNTAAAAHAPPSASPNLHTQPSSSEGGGEFRIVQVNVLAKSDGRGLIFEERARRFSSSTDNPHNIQRPPLDQRHNVTLPQLMVCGVQQFVWLPDVGPHGGFAYFYADEDNDCFFVLKEARQSGGSGLELLNSPAPALPQRRQHGGFRLAGAAGLALSVNRWRQRALANMSNKSDVSSRPESPPVGAAGSAKATPRAEDADDLDAPSTAPIANLPPSAPLPNRIRSSPL